MAGRGRGFLAAGCLVAVALLATEFSGITGTAAPGHFAEQRAPWLTPGRDVMPYEPPVGRFDAHRIVHDGTSRRWYGYAPPVRGRIPPPAIVLLHGSGRDGRAMLDMWQALADREGVVLIAPDALDSGGWSVRDDDAAFLSSVVDDARRITPFDPEQMFLFGHSAGAVYSLMLANRVDGQWRAVAVHGGAIGASQVHPARRPVPIRLYLGEEDQLFDAASARAGAHALADAGHDTTLVLIPRHTHWYYGIGPTLSDAAWAFFSSTLRTTARQDSIGAQWSPGG